MANAKKTAAGTRKAGGPKKGPIEDVANVILNAPGVKEKGLELLMGLISKLLNKKPKPVDPVPPVVTKPVPNPNQVDPDLIDDVIPSPAPTEKRTVKEVKLTLAGGQLNKQRFPDAPNGGLIPMAELHQIQAGKMAINYASKIWLDLTAYDQHGKEFLPGDVIAFDMCYATEHHCGDAFIKGNGGSPQNPAQYEAEDTSEVGNGISSWIATLGFKHQMKVHGEGSFECWGSVKGIKSNSFTIKVS